MTRTITAGQPRPPTTEQPVGDPPRAVFRVGSPYRNSQLGQRGTVVETPAIHYGHGGPVFGVFTPCCKARHRRSLDSCTQAPGLLLRCNECRWPWRLQLRPTTATEQQLGTHVARWTSWPAVHPGEVLA